MSHHLSAPSSSTLISITIEGLYGVDLTGRSVKGQTATVSFGGSIANMQIGSSRLCSVSGCPVIESRPVISNKKVSWSTEFSHLMLSTNTTNDNTTKSHGGAWSDALPEILEISVRFGTAVGVCHLIVGQVDPPYSVLPVRSQDAILNKGVTLKVKIVRDEDTSVAPSIAPCSTQSSFHADLRTLVGLPARNVHLQHQSSCYAFSFRDLRRALLACQPTMLDDTSTIATHDSWDM